MLEQLPLVLTVHTFINVFLTEHLTKTVSHHEYASMYAHSWLCASIWYSKDTVGWAYCYYFSRRKLFSIGTQFVVKPRNAAVAYIYLHTEVENVLLTIYSCPILSSTLSYLIWKRLKDKVHMKINTLEFFLSENTPKNSLVIIAT